MDRFLYISSVGLSNIEQAQAARANNLANVSTAGFRADLARVTGQEVYEDAYRTRVYAVNEGAGVDLSVGTLMETGNAMDVALKGDGLMAVVDEQGQEGYTRGGSLHVNHLGQLVDTLGRQALGQGGPIALPPFESILFGEDGSITIRPQGQGAEALVQIDQLKLVNPRAEEIYKGSNGLLYGRQGAPLEPANDVGVQSGFLETSNVNGVHELTEIISLARQFELEVRMMKVAETNDETASQLLRIG